MILVADSGSTKTTWALLSEGKVMKMIRTAGLNPYFHSHASVGAILKEELIPGLGTGHVVGIHFYGAGCSTENNNKMLKEVMMSFFDEADIRIYHDILGAARSLFGDRSGIACILGTGCNACWYDGKEVFSKVPSLGYMFGDEGAGSYLGKKFIGSYLKGRLPEDLSRGFAEQYRLSLEDILNALYNRPNPNRWLASFSEFIAPRQDHPFLREMIRNSFLDFFREQLFKYENYQEVQVGFVGSIAYVYQNILAEAAKDSGVRIDKVLNSPLEGLIAYHSAL